MTATKALARSVDLNTNHYQVNPFERSGQTSPLTLEKDPETEHYNVSLTKEVFGLHLMDTERVRELIMSEMSD